MNPQGQPIKLSDSEIAQRYRLIQPIGAGGMGEVFQAHDRLTGQDVALKRVQVPVEALAFNSSSSALDPRLALTKEFQVAATLRHPNVVSIYDYGFDAHNQPFFTMELLNAPRTLLDAGQNEPDSVKFNLLAQALQALIYIHRRGILHRDIKPGNVLVVGNQVKVVDFGLATDTNAAHSGFGTIPYLAPEMLYTQTRPGTRLGAGIDLYPIGVIAYELFAGEYPFPLKNLNDLIHDILYTPPDLTRIPEKVRPIVGQLMAKTTFDRYVDAADALRDLSAISGDDLLGDSTSIREGFLQAARFVGRDTELQTLCDALTDASSGKGSLWLVGGESGVGKSRLLDELRIRALVGKALVIRGQAIENGGLPYQLWREPLRRLVLAVELTDVEAGILKTIVPDIAILLGRPIADAPELSGSAGQERLTLSIIDVFRRFGGPLLLLLEDLQWSDESLNPIKRLLNHIEDMPLLVIASYRDDERPDLPTILPGARPLKLERLPESAIGELCTSMIGEAAQNADVIELVQRETEGNTFFIVEVVRALAEEAGQLEMIGQHTLPGSVFTGGLQQLVRRRLSRVPDWGHDLLRLAAVGGRALDPAVLRPLAGDLDYDRWLRICADVVVLEVHDNTWRFVHDKLREGVLHELDEAQRAGLHRRIAEAIEHAYPGDTAQAEVLIEHWHSAGDPRKELEWLAINTQRLTRLTAQYRRSAAYIERALALVPAEDDVQRAEFLIRLGETCWRQGNFDGGLEAANTALTLVRRLQHRALEASGLSLLGVCTSYRGGYIAAEPYFQQSLALYRELDDRAGIASTLSQIGTAAWTRGDLKRADEHYQQSLGLRRALDDKFGIASTLNNLGNVAGNRGDFATARDFFLQSIEIKQVLGDKRGLGVSYFNVAGAAVYMGALDDAERYFQQSLAIRLEIDDPAGIGDCYHGLAEVSRMRGELDKALDYQSRSLLRRREIGDQDGTAQSLMASGLIAEIQGKLEDAAACIAESLELRRAIDDRPEQIASLSSLNRISLKMRRPEAARAHLQAAFQLCTEIEGVPYMLLVVLGAAEWALYHDQPEHAAELCGLVLNNPHLPAETRTDTDALIARLNGLPEAVKEAALKRGAAMEFDAVLKAEWARLSE
ncbi:MAG: tetratricopeptide repeat protein [Anaerolineae bacterium]